MQEQSNQNTRPVRFSPLEQVTQNLREKGIQPTNLKLSKRITQRGTTGNANYANEKMVILREDSRHNYDQEE